MTLMASPEFATWDCPLKCCVFRKVLMPDDINGKNPSGTKRFWIRNYSLSGSHPKPNSLHKLDHLVSLFHSFIVII